MRNGNKSVKFCNRILSEKSSMHNFSNLIYVAYIPKMKNFNNKIFRFNELISFITNEPPNKDITNECLL